MFRGKMIAGTFAFPPDMRSPRSCERYAYNADVIARLVQTTTRLYRDIGGDRDIRKCQANETRAALSKPE